MLGMLMMIVAEQAVAETTPAFTSFSVSTPESGVCGPIRIETPATIRIEWTATGFDSALHRFRVLQNGGLLASTTDLLHDKLVYKVLGNHCSVQVMSWSFRVELQRVSDGQVLASTEAYSYSEEYGNCACGEMQ